MTLFHKKLIVHARQKQYYGMLLKCAEEKAQQQMQIKSNEALAIKSNGTHRHTQKTACALAQIIAAFSGISQHIAMPLKQPHKYTNVDECVCARARLTTNQIKTHFSYVINSFIL